MAEVDWAMADFAGGWTKNAVRLCTLTLFGSDSPCIENGFMPGYLHWLQWIFSNSQCSLNQMQDLFSPLSISWISFKTVCTRCYNCKQIILAKQSIFSYVNVCVTVGKVLASVPLSASGSFAHKTLVIQRFFWQMVIFHGEAISIPIQQCFYMDCFSPCCATLLHNDSLCYLAS